MIPVGNSGGHHRIPIDKSTDIIEKLTEKYKPTHHLKQLMIVRQQIGSLGGGNHFLEVRN